MGQLLEQTGQRAVERSPFTPQHRGHVKQELRRRIYAALQIAKDLPPVECLKEIEARLLAIQAYCKAVERSFIMVKVKITCDQYGLGGCHYDTATLFRGPSEDASVAICVTAKGSLLHRNGWDWKAYQNMGDVDPVVYYLLTQT